MTDSNGILGYFEEVHLWGLDGLSLGLVGRPFEFYVVRFSHDPSWAYLLEYFDGSGPEVCHGAVPACA